MACGPNVVQDVIFCRLQKVLWYGANACPLNLVLEKFFFKRKKSFMLKLHENSHEAMVDNCYRLRVALLVMTREVMTFFFEDQHHFKLHYTISRDRCLENW